MKARSLVLAIWPAVLLAGCPSHTFLSVKDQEAICNKHEDQVYHLKQSFYVGPFFTYDDRMFISERAFDERALIESPGGDPILPSQPTGILPMGTRVKIQRIEFPTGSVVSNRKLKSPRHFTWVMLAPQDIETDKPYVLVLTQDLRRPADFTSALRMFLVDQDPRDQFAAPEELEAIAHKKLIKGMGVDAVFRSRGHPDKITRKQEAGAKVERWQYAPGREVVLKDNRVESWKGFPSFDVEILQPADGSAGNGS